MEETFYNYVFKERRSSRHSDISPIPKNLNISFPSQRSSRLLHYFFQLADFTHQGDDSRQELRGIFNPKQSTSCPRELCSTHPALAEAGWHGRTAFLRRILLSPHLAACVEHELPPHPSGDEITTPLPNHPICKAFSSLRLLIKGQSFRQGCPCPASP